MYEINIIYVKADFSNIINVVDNNNNYSDIQLCNNCTITSCQKGFYYDEHLAKCIGEFAFYLISGINILL